MIRLLGAGGHAANILDILLLNHRSVEVYDDNPSRILLYKHISGSLDSAILNADDREDIFIVGIGNNEVRETWSQEVIGAGLRIADLVPHPKSIISDHAAIGKGTVVMAGAIVQARAEVGDGVIINTGATVDHDCVIYDYAHICPGVNLAGNVTVGARTMIGIGSSVIQGIYIGPDIIVGAGSVVVDNLYQPGVYVGAPARLIKERN